MPSPIQLVVEDHFEGVDGTPIISHAPDVDTVGGGWIQVKVNGGAEVAGTTRLRTLSAGIRWGAVTDFYGSIIDCGTPNVDINVLYRTQSGDNERYEILLRFDNPTHNGYAISLRSDFSDVRLYKITAGTYATVTFVPFNFTINTDYQIRVIAYGQKVRVYIDSVLILSYDTLIDYSTYNTHGLDRRSDPGGVSYFDDLYIYSGVPI